ncbi:phosphoadenylyl-sulfate reductase [Ghiorsea bivora]|uniref:phosphoadenylyl-sulfate reductase n=1 Tax=Ghiorsea bivora TaxID=1485545 RepID=UPI00056FCAC1|nr:phosphoadenylyl-sulfate reductase [Ghiorsea bivora]
MNILADKVEYTLGLLQQAVADYAGDVVFACSFGAEDVVLLDLLDKHHIPIRVISLDTGRLPQETYDVMQIWRKKSSLDIDIYFPDAREVEKMIKQDGVNLFYDSVEKRKLCCHVRKILPLKRALSGAQAWVTGLRQEQADSRANMHAVEDDQAFGIKKFNPLIMWTAQDVWDYIKSHDVPYNALHDQFYPSIGCAPCTRAISVGEDPRAGRWWWEQEDAVAECGLHANPIKK